MGCSADKLNHLPAWIFHGEKYTDVDPAYSVMMHKAFPTIGTPVKLTIYPGVGHDSWTAAYNDPALWEWLFQQER